MVAVGLVSQACWWPLVLRMRRIPRPAGYKGGILKRYQENSPGSPLPTIIRVCTVVFYGTLAYWIWASFVHK